MFYFVLRLDIISKKTSDIDENFAREWLSSVTYYPSPSPAPLPPQKKMTPSHYLPVNNYSPVFIV